MAKVEITLVWNSETRKRDILVDYTSDAGALPMEHEADHKKLLDSLIEGGLLKAEEAGQLLLSRGNEGAVDLADGQHGTEPVRRSVKKES